MCIYFLTWYLGAIFVVPGNIHTLFIEKYIRTWQPNWNWLLFNLVGDKTPSHTFCCCWCSNNAFTDRLVDCSWMTKITYKLEEMGPRKLGESYHSMMPMMTSMSWTIGMPFAGHLPNMIHVIYHIFHTIHLHLLFWELNKEKNCLLKNMQRKIVRIFFLHSIHLSDSVLKCVKRFVWGIFLPCFVVRCVHLKIWIINFIESNIRE